MITSSILLYMIGIAVAAFIFKNELVKEDKIFRWWDNLFYADKSKLLLQRMKHYVSEKEITIAYKEDQSLPAPETWKGTPEKTIDFLDDQIDFFLKKAEENKRVLNTSKLIYYPLGGCDKCLSGQLALWSGIYYCWANSISVSVPLVFDFVIGISFVIFLVVVLNKCLPQECDV